MKCITLSDHTRDMKFSLEKARQEEFKNELIKYNSTIKSITDQRNRTSYDIHSHWKNRRYFLLLCALIRRIGFLFSIHPSKPKMRNETKEEIIWKAGRDGEMAVHEQFSRHFQDEWVMINGYKNGGGEIDSLLVGPEGIYAIEIKNINGTIMINGDSWTKDKYDKYGNIVEHGRPIRDRKGRSPSQQVNHAADKLERFLLNRNAPIGRIVRGVILSHGRSEIYEKKNETVDFIFAQEINFDYFKTISPKKIPDAALDIIVNLIRQDHNFNNQSPKPTVRDSLRANPLLR